MRRMKNTRLTPGQSVEPAYIFSLPRSGSTLLQRVLATNDNIATAAEPWLLLPFIYVLKDRGVFAEYSHIGVYGAVKDFCQELPNGQDDYYYAIGLSARCLYQKIAKNGECYFLDKTPRYSLICNEIMRVFPDGKYIFLWRNPLSVIASMIETWGSGVWNIFKYKVDLFEGLNEMLDCYAKNKSESVSLNNEALVQHPEEFQRVFEYLELEINHDYANSFKNIKFSGGLGDPTGVKRYSDLSEESTDKWINVISNPFRKAWCRNYLRWLGPKRLELMGYDLDVLLAALNESPTNLDKLGRDIVAAIYGVFYCLLEPSVFRAKIKMISNWRRLYKLS